LEAVTPPPIRFIPTTGAAANARRLNGAVPKGATRFDALYL
jgi:hypothetical protein